MIDKNLVKDYLKKEITDNIEYADVFAEESISLNISLDDDKIEEIISGNDSGIGIRTINKGKTEYQCKNITLSDKKIQISDIDKKVKMVNIANKVARSYDSRIKQVSISYAERIQNIAIANSIGNIINEERYYTVFFINVISSDNGIIQTGYESIGKSRQLKLHSELDPEKIAREAAKRAILMLTAKPSPADVMPVVLDKESGGVMIHEAIGHSLESDIILKGMSKFTGKIGEKVASSLINVVDDPTIPELFGSYNYDDEGIKSKKTVLVENGILINYLYDIDSYIKSGKKDIKTGNGRRESYQHKPIPRMSNTFIASGNSDTSDIIKQVKKGLYVKKMGGGQVNPVTGDFVFDVKEGYIIENGEIKYPVRGAILTGNGMDVLKKIEVVGKELEFMPGRCGKSGQSVPVTDAEPTILISDIVIGGTNI